MTTTQLQAWLSASYEPLFRLALLATGNPRQAGVLLGRAVAQARDISDFEPALLRGLVPRRAGYGTWQPSAQALARSGLNQRQLAALLRLIGTTAPATRLVLGLHYLRGLATEEIAPLLGSYAASLASLLASFRAASAVALGFAPPRPSAT